VQIDDLGVTVGSSAPDLPGHAFDIVLVLLVRLAARLHKQSALLRARRERSEPQLRSTRSEQVRRRSPPLPSFLAGRTSAIEHTF
jgi:hypothetical protein